MNTPLRPYRTSQRVRLRRIATAAVALLLACACTASLAACEGGGPTSAASSAEAADAAAVSAQAQASAPPASIFSAEDAPAYAERPSAEINGGIPFFEAGELTLSPRETYSALDGLGRCGPACALLGPETMPTETRGSIGMVKPSGWRIATYDWIDGRYLFNRCHLIAYSLAGENDNPLNLITGTRSMNACGMLPYEERVLSYINSSGNHVLYRVTPVFEGENLVASGVLMEAQSIEDDGAGVRFCAWCYNVEPGVVIDYATGDSHAEDPAESPPAQAVDAQTYVLNTNTHRFHYPDCPSVTEMKDKNKLVVEKTRDELVAEGYRPCGKCKP